MNVAQLGCAGERGGCGCRRIVAEGVLCAQVGGDVREGFCKIALLRNIVESSSGVGCELDEGVLAAGVTAGVG